MEQQAPSAAELAPPELAAAEQVEAAPEAEAIRAEPAVVGGDGPKGACQEDVDLSSTSLPFSSIKRIVRTASPGVRFSAEAVAGFHRVAQAFALFATDRSLAEQAKEAEKAKKASKSKNPPLMRKTVTAEHVMKFLTAELPPIATKVASLFPELMPGDFKPAGVQLMEQLSEQSRAAQAARAHASGASSSSPVKGKDLGSWAKTGASEDGQVPSPEKRHLASDDVAETEHAAKKARSSRSTAGDDISSKLAAAKKAKETKVVPAVQSAPLSKFFGAPKAPVKSVSPEEQVEAVPADADAQPAEVEAMPMDEDAQPREV